MTTSEELQAKIETLEKQINANYEDLEKDKAEKAKVAAATAAIKLAMSHMSANERKAYRAKALAGTDETLKAAFSSIPDESFYSGESPSDKTNRSSIEGDGRVLSSAEIEEKKKEKEQMDAKVKSLEARIEAYEKTESQSYIDQLTAHKTAVVKNLNTATFKEALGAKTLDQLKTMYEDRKDEIEAMASGTQNPASGKSFPFTASESNPNNLTSLNSIMGVN